MQKTYKAVNIAGDTYCLLEDDGKTIGKKLNLIKLDKADTCAEPGSIYTFDLEDIKETYPAQAWAKSSTKEGDGGTVLKGQMSMAAPFLGALPDRALLLDVRTDEEYAQGHLPQSLHLPLDSLEEGIEKLIPDKETFVLVYCRSGVRSGKAAKKMAKMGYSLLANLGGILDYKGEIEK